MSTVDYTQPPWGTFGRNIVLGVVSGGSNFITKGLNKFHVNGLQKFQEAVLQREEGTPLFTVSNHTSTLDDPVLFSAMLPWSFFWTESQHLKTRWSLCAKEMCYNSLIFSHIFQNGKTLPIERGQGIDQEIMKVAAQKASEGDWVHVFPEAKIGYTGKLQTLKWGIGKLICDAYREDQPPERQPLVLPFYHSGMGHVLPKGSIVPRYGNDIYVEVGDSVYLRDVLPRCKCKGKEQKAWEEITKRIALALTDLERKAVPNWDQKQNTEAQQRGIPPPIEAS